MNVNFDLEREEKKAWRRVLNSIFSGVIKRKLMPLTIESEDMDLWPEPTLISHKRAHWVSFRPWSGMPFWNISDFMCFAGSLWLLSDLVLVFGVSLLDYWCETHQIRSIKVVTEIGFPPVVLQALCMINFDMEAYLKTLLEANHLLTSFVKVSLCFLTSSPQPACHWKATLVWSSKYSGQRT